MTALYIIITVLWGIVSFAFGISVGRQIMLDNVKTVLNKVSELMEDENGEESKM